MLAAVFAFFAGCLVTFWYVRRNPRPSRSSWLIVFNGSSWSMAPARILPSGNIVDNYKSEHSIGLCSRVDAPASLGVVYALPVESVPLADHRMMEQGRKSILKGYLLKPGGDMTQLATMVMCAFAIAAAVYSYSSMSSINSALARNQVVLEQLVAWTNSPLEVKK